MEEINNFQQEPEENLYQAWERFKELLIKCPQYYLTEMQEVILFYNGLRIPTRQILDSRGTIPSKTAADAKVAIQEMAEYSPKWHNGTSRSRSTATSNGLAAIQAQLNNLGREIKKVNEKVYATQVGCEQCKGPHYTKDCPLKEEGKALKEAYYTKFGGPFQGGGYRAAALGFNQRNNANPSYQERRQFMEDTLSKFMNAAIRNEGASIKTLEIQIGQLSKVLQERRFGSLPSSTEANPRDQVKSISTTIEVDSYPIRRIGSNQYATGSYGPQFLKAYSEASHINNPIPRKEKDPGSFTLPCFINNVCFDNALVDLGANSLHAKFKRKRGRLGLKLWLIGEDFELNRSLDPFFEDYTELNDLNKPFELRRNQGDDLMPTIEEGEVIEEFRTWDDELDDGIDDYPSYCDYDKKIHIDFLENTDTYRDEGMGDVSEKDEINGISHAYQKLKGFYKGLLNLGPDYIRDEKMEEWLTRGHISVHEME
ncbi:hypothetical protein Tco_0389353 [Tanacetum coccineum]